MKEPDQVNFFSDLIVLLFSSFNAHHICKNRAQKHINHVIINQNQQNNDKEYRHFLLENLYYDKKKKKKKKKNTILRRNRF